MASFDFLLKRYERRRRRYELLQFTEVAGLFVEAGYDLAYGWSEALRSLGPSLSPGLAKALLRPEAGLGEGLEQLARSYVDPAHRIWFAMLHELYGSGAGLRDAIGAMATALRSEHERELETHCRELPTKLNVGLLLFFLPATFLLLFAPLLVELGGAFTR